MHTSGPWFPRNADFVEEEIIANVDQDGYGDLICDKICVVDCGNPRWRENARLISAAPDLLTALEKIVDIGRNDFGQAAASRMVDFARAAIAKATGKP